MPRGWPPLEVREVTAILTALGFSYSHSKGGHDFYKGTMNGTACTVTVDAKCGPFGVYLLKMMCAQAGCTRAQFYGATEASAKKIR